MLFNLAAKLSKKNCMQVVRITKEFGMEMSHVLWNYDGPCKNVHGHSYKLFVTLIGNPLNEFQHPKNGMLIDFTDFKAIIKSEIINLYDHALIICNKADSEYIKRFKETFTNVVSIDFQPTCENLVVDFAKKIKPKLPQNIKLFSIKLYETSTSYAEWYASDNE